MDGVGRPIGDRTDRSVVGDVRSPNTVVVAGGFTGVGAEVVPGVGMGAGADTGGVGRVLLASGFGIAPTVTRGVAGVTGVAGVAVVRGVAACGVDNGAATGVYGRWGVG